MVCKENKISGPKQNMQAISFSLVLVACVVVAVAILWYQDSGRRKPCSVPSVKEPAQKPPALFDAVTVRNSSVNPNRVFKADQWHLEKADSGAFSFTASNPGNGSLIVYLVDDPNSQTLSDSRGYAVVFHQERDEPYVVVSSVPGLPTQHVKSRRNKGHRIGVEPRQYWIVYEEGTLIVGCDGKPSDKEAKIVTVLKDDDAAPRNLTYFGFGALRTTTTDGIEISNIRTFDAPAKGCNWRATIPVTCKGGACEVSTMHAY